MHESDASGTASYLSLHFTPELLALCALQPVCSITGTNAKIPCRDQKIDLWCEQ